MKCAVLCDGPGWWGDPNLMPDGSGVDVSNLARFRERRAEVANEVRGTLEAIETLPEGTLVIHAPGRGAPAIFALGASQLGYPTLVAPADVLLDVALGLRSIGWKVKSLMVDDVGRPELQALIKSRMFVRQVERWVEPEEPVEGD